MLRRITHLLQRIRKDRLGAVLAEFAIATPFLAMLVIKTFDYSLLILVNMQIESAARAGAAYAVAHSLDSVSRSVYTDSIELAIRSATTPHSQYMSAIATDPTSIWYGCVASNTVITHMSSATDTCSDGSTAGEYATVYAKTVYTYIMPIIGTPSTKNLNANETVRIR